MQLQLWEGLQRSGEPTAHGRGITALDRALAATARNSDYPTAPQHCSDTGNGQEAQKWLRSQDPDGSCCSAQQIPGFSSFQGLANPALCVLCPLHHSTRGWGLENTTSNITKLILGLIWVWGLFVVVFFFVKAGLLSCTT